MSTLVDRAIEYGGCLGDGKVEDTVSRTCAPMSSPYTGRMECCPECGGIGVEK